MTKQKKMLMWSILLIGAMQMPTNALYPSINQIATEVFPEVGLSVVQTAMQLSSVISPFLTILLAFLISKGVTSKRTACIAGLIVVGLTGVTALIAHTQFWHLCLLGIMLGVGISGFIANATSLIMDNFNENERQFISGYQTSAINGGGIVMAFGGGALASLMWYGGYIMLLLAFPVALFAIKAIPKASAKTVAIETTKRDPLPKDVYMYSLLIFFFMMMFQVGGSNISTHLGSTALSGIATGIQMTGGVACGIFFGKLSEKLGDKLLACAYFALFAGFMIIGLFPGSVVMAFIGIFIAGMSMSLMLPQTMFSISKMVNASNSAFATSVSTCIAPGFGSFLSAMVFTNITQTLFGESTTARYFFTAGVALVISIIVFIIMSIREKRK